MRAAARRSPGSSSQSARRGFVPDPEYSKVGWCASDTRELSFDDCRVPAENLLGERDRGYAQFLQILDEGRVAIAALATGRFCRDAKILEISRLRGWLIRPAACPRGVLTEPGFIV